MNNTGINPNNSSDNSEIFDMSCCRLCPRECGANRAAGQAGFCGETAEIHAARAALLYYEEPCISGKAGSGAVFFTGCNLGCVFCQNQQIAKGILGERNGLPVQAEELADIFIRLQEEEKANNINLVTASHFLPQIIPALQIAKSHGLKIPVVYNTSAYEKVEAIRALDGLVDIYLPDLKYYSSGLAARWSSVPDYFAVAAGAIAEMVRQCPQPVFADGSHELDAENDEDDPLMKRGVIVRHLVIPGQAEDSKKIVEYLYRTYGNSIFISIMNQYTPMPQVMNDPVLSRTVTDQEYNDVVEYAIRLGVENGFLQEGGTVSKSFIPDFDGTGIY